MGRVNDWTGIWAARGYEVLSSVGDFTGTRGVVSGERECLCSGREGLESSLEDMVSWSALGSRKYHFR